MAGSGRPGTAVLVARRMGAPARHEEPRVGFQGDRPICGCGGGRRHWARRVGSIRGAGTPSTSTLPGFVLHGAGRGVRRIARSIRIAAVMSGVGWRLFVPLSLGMYFAQRQVFPASAHIEWPGAQPRNPWAQAFEWIRANTPVDALFALDPPPHGTVRAKMKMDFALAPNAACWRIWSKTRERRRCSRRFP